MSQEEIEGQFEEIAPAEYDNTTTEHTILSAMGDDPNDVRWMITVFRIPTDGGKDIALFRLNDPHQITNIMDKLLPYGTGEYRVIVYRNGRIFKKMIYPVEAPPISLQPEKQNPQSGMSEILAEIREQNKQTMQFFERVFERREDRPQTPAINPMEMMQQTLEMAASLAGLRGNQAPAPAGPSPSDMMGLIKMGMEISENSGPSAKSGPMDIIGKLLTPEVLQTIFQQPARIEPMPLGAPSPHATHIQRSPQNIPWQMQLISELVPQLVAAAQRNADVNEGAEWLLDQLPVGLAKTVLSDKEFLPKLEVGVPQIVPYHGWFAATLDAARKLLNDDELRGDNPNPGRPSGSAGDDESHAADTPQGHPRPVDGAAS